MSAATRLDLAIAQIRFARQYTLSLLDDLTEDDWFRSVEGVSHIAWQVGHLAMAQYGLCLFRIRGRQPIDTELMTSSFRKKFSKGTTPNPNASVNPSPQEIRDVLDRVYDQAMSELPQITDQQLDEPLEEPYAAFPTKLGGLLFCSHHEMLHAGQIGLVRRLLGRAPIR